MNNFGYDKVDITGGFLYQKQKLNEEVSINSVYDRFYETGRIDALKCNWKEGMDNKPHAFWDSDVAKWVEGAAYILKKRPGENLERKIESIIEDIEENQEECGYFNSYFIVCEPKNRFKNRSSHELYCAGHFIEAAVAYYEVTGRGRLLKCMEKYVDYIYKVFVEEKSAAFVTPGHEEIELALLRLYRLTKKEKYLELCKYFIYERGRHESDNPTFQSVNSSYEQSHIPVTEQKDAVGHCVRACYLYTAMADLAYEINDEELKDACKLIFGDIVNRKMYITGGIGSERTKERFSIPFDLPNEFGYSETCSSIALIFFASKMLQLENKAIYADVIERVLYNAMMAGISTDGKSYFYDNLLEINLQTRRRVKQLFPNEPFYKFHGSATRAEVFECSCCPPNINRFLATLGNYIFGYDEKTVYVNQFIQCELKSDNMCVIMKTDYPNNGKIEIDCSGVGTLAVRIPYWCGEYSISEEYTLKDGYAYIIPNGKTITVEFAMTPVLIEANAKVRENYGKAAVCKGPFVYCAEGVDNGDLYEFAIDKDLAVREEYDDCFNVNVLYARGYRKKDVGELYSPLNDNTEECEIKMIPYHCFANRGETDMLVFMNYA